MRKLILIVGVLGGTASAGALGACGSSSDPTAPKIDAGNAVVGDDDAGSTPEAETFSVGGTVAGLLGTGLVLQNNSGDDIPVAKDGSFTFPTKLKAGAVFAVTIQTQPSAPAQTCTVSGNTGTIGSADVGSVLVNCATNAYAIGGTVTGLAGTGLVLRNNGGNDLTISADGTFAFSAPEESGQPYAVTTASQPTNPWQTCTVTSASGIVGTSAVTNIAVTCATNTYKIQGLVLLGLGGTGLVLQNNGGDNLPISTHGKFEFALPVASGATFDVSVKAQPTSRSQTCTVANGTGTIQGADFDDVTVNCTTNSYTVGGSIIGLVGTVVLTNNGGDDLTLDTDGNFTFPKKVPSGNTYNVAVKTQPPGRTCILEKDVRKGTVTNSNVLTVAVKCSNCVPAVYTHSGFEPNCWTQGHEGFTEVTSPGWADVIDGTSTSLNAGCNSCPPYTTKRVFLDYGIYRVTSQASGCDPSGLKITGVYPVSGACGP